MIGIKRRSRDNRGNKTVSVPGNSSYEARVFGIVSEDLPDLPDSAVNAVVGVEKSSFPPDAFDDLVPCNQLAIPLNQKDEDFRGDPLEFQEATRAAESLGTRIELEIVSESDRK